jgi:hypothetical protein
MKAPNSVKRIQRFTPKPGASQRSTRKNVAQAVRRISINFASIAKDDSSVQNERQRAGYERLSTV